MDPTSPEVEHALVGGSITQVRILAEPTEPVAVCRLLLKMGLEVVGSDSLDAALSIRFDAARSFARRPERGRKWWFLLVCDHAKLFRRFRDGITAAEWAESVSLGTTEQEGIEVFRLQLLDIDMIVPLQTGIEPAPDLRSNEPDWRVFEVRA